MRAVESDDEICRGLEGCACFIFHQEGVEISTKTIAEEEEAGETADGGGMDRALIVEGQFEAGKIGVDAGACGDCETIAFGDGACRTVKVLEDAVDCCRGYFWVNSCPGRSIDGGDHVGAGWVAHSFMKPHDLLNKVRVKGRLFDCAIGCC